MKNKLRNYLQRQFSKLYIHVTRDVFLTLIFFGVLFALPIFLINIINMSQTLYLIIIIATARLWDRISLIMSDVQDTVRFHYDISIFDNGPDSYWKCIWKKKYVNNDKNQGHKKFKFLFWYFDVPAMFINAWHLAKIIEIWAENSAYWNLIICIFPQVKGLEWYCLFLIISSVRVYYYHVDIFYGGIFLKEKNNA